MYEVEENYFYEAVEAVLLEAERAGEEPNERYLARIAKSHSAWTAQTNQDVRTPIRTSWTGVVSFTRCGAVTSVEIIGIVDEAFIRILSLIEIHVLLGNGRGGMPEALDDLFRRKAGDTPVRLRLEMPGEFSVLLDVPIRVKPDEDFYTAVERICGPAIVEPATP